VRPKIGITPAKSIRTPFFSKRRIRAALFSFKLPLDIATQWLRGCLFDSKPQSFPLPVAPNRDFCITLFTTKIEATIKKLGYMIEWESDGNNASLIAAAAKNYLLRLIPHIIPLESELALSPVLFSNIAISKLTIC